MDRSTPLPQRQQLRLPQPGQRPPPLPIALSVMLGASVDGEGSLISNVVLRKVTKRPIFEVRGVCVSERFMQRDLPVCAAVRMALAIRYCMR